MTNEQIHLEETPSFWDANSPTRYAYAPSFPALKGLRGEVEELQAVLGGMVK